MNQNTTVYLKNLADARSVWREGLLSTTPKKRTLKLVDSRDTYQSILLGYITKKTIIRDLYISVKEDLEEETRGNYWNSVKEFEKWYSTASQEVIEDILKEAIWCEGYGKYRTLERKLVNYFFGDRYQYPPKPSPECKKEKLHSKAYGKAKPVFKWRFPDGHIEELTAMKAHRSYISKGIQLEKLL